MFLYHVDPKRVYHNILGAFSCQWNHQACQEFWDRKILSRWDLAYSNDLTNLCRLPLIMVVLGVMNLFCYCNTVLFLNFLLARDSIDLWLYLSFLNFQSNLVIVLTDQFVQEFLCTSSPQYLASQSILMNKSFCSNSSNSPDFSHLVEESTDCLSHSRTYLYFSLLEHRF